MENNLTEHCGFTNVVVTSLDFENARDFEAGASLLAEKMKHNDRWGVKVGHDEMVVSFSDYPTGSILTLWREPCVPRLIVQVG